LLVLNIVNLSVKSKFTGVMYLLLKSLVYIIGHPSTEVVARLHEAARVVHRTDRDGALVLRSDGRQWRVVDWR